MKWKRFGFLRHYRKIRIEGLNFINVLNKCIKDGIILRDIRWKNPLESTMKVRGEDYQTLRKMAGHSYKMTVLREGGAVPLFRSMKANIVTVIGAFLLGALIFYQSLFVAEIRIDGYRSIDETAIRQTLEAEGLYEGARKPQDYNGIKAALYREYGKITWVSVFEEGRLVKINIAEAGKQMEEIVADEKPANIIAARSGIIEKVIPLQGIAKVEKGDYVNEGDVLISGRYKYQSSDYSRGDDFFMLYSHAQGQAFAKVPLELSFYFEKNRREKEPTGRSVSGISIQLGDWRLDTTKGLYSYEASVREEREIIALTRPLPLKVSLTTVREVELVERPQEPKRLRKVVEAALRQYEKDELEKGEQILTRTIDYYEQANTIRAGVLLEILEEIGIEKEIKEKKEKKEGAENQ